MIPSQREVVIQQMLARQEVVTVNEICEQCGCSPETARRDLRRLEQKGMLIRTHGGAIAVASENHQHRPSSGPSLLEARLALAERADALIVTPSDTKATRVLVERCKRSGMPIVAEATYYPGATTVVAVDNFRAGQEAGRWVADYARQHFQGKVVVLVLGYPQSNTEARSRGFIDGLHTLPADDVRIIRVNGSGLYESARQIAADALTVHPDINVIFGINDDSALGALAAYRAAGLDDSRLLLVSFGLEGKRTKDLLEQTTPYTVAVAMFPELMGRACVDAAICAYHGCYIPDCIATPYALVTPDSLHNYYYRDPATGNWLLNWTRAETLRTGSAGYALLGECHNPRTPKRIGYIGIFGSHEWYQNLKQTMREHSAARGVTLEVVDASFDMVRELDALKQSIGFAAAQYVLTGDTIILDAGHTTKYVARALKGRTGITIITNSLYVLDELRDEPGITLVVSGGVLRRESQSLVGPGAEATFQDLRVDKVFVSVTGLSLDFGLSNTNISEATVKQAMLAAAREAILLADSSKIGVESLVKIAPLSSVSRLITDSGIHSQERLALTQSGIEVITTD